MPFYDYACAACGEFRAIRPMAESSAPQACPGCAAPCARVLSAPFLAGHGSSSGKPQGGDGQAPVRWRTACGFGCSHARHAV